MRPYHGSKISIARGGDTIDGQQGRVLSATTREELVLYERAISGV